MELPSISHIVRDEERDIEFKVLAYRRLTDAEVMTALRAWRRSYRKKLKPRHSYTVVTTIGSV